MTASFEFTCRRDGAISSAGSLEEALGESPLRGAKWLWVAPHDDDLCMGGGLFLQAAAQAGVDSRIVVVTDGRLGYCRPEDQSRIIEIRKEETYRSFEMLGVPRSAVTFLGYRDGDAFGSQGRRPAREGEPEIAGYTGIQNSLTYWLRKVRPSRVIVPTSTDLHPDHRITHSELMISIFHAGGAIWPELGEPIERVPRVTELAVYCDFVDLPQIRIRANDEAFQKKLDSVLAYQSQAQIASAIATMRRAGPLEFLRDVEFRLYSPENYRSLFGD
jgi:LmbE family N-acetylglucosaminyl deacetylase